MARQGMIYGAKTENIVKYPSENDLMLIISKGRQRRCKVADSAWLVRDPLLVPAE
jgi:hypothetical protein